MAFYKSAILGQSKSCDKSCDKDMLNIVLSMYLSALENGIGTTNVPQVVSTLGCGNIWW